MAVSAWRNDGRVTSDPVLRAPVGCSSEWKSGEVHSDQSRERERADPFCFRVPLPDGPPPGGIFARLRQTVYSEEGRTQ